MRKRAVCHECSPQCSLDRVCACVRVDVDKDECARTHWCTRVGEHARTRLMQAHAFVGGGHAWMLRRQSIGLARARAELNRTSLLSTAASALLVSVDEEAVQSLLSDVCCQSASS